MKIKNRKFIILIFIFFIEVHISTDKFTCRSFFNAPFEKIYSLVIIFLTFIIKY